MYRFFVEESQIYDGTVHITGSDVNHIKNVLRMRPGEKILVSTGGEKEYHCAVSDFPEGEVLAAVEEVTAALNVVNASRSKYLSLQQVFEDQDKLSSAELTENAFNILFTSEGISNLLTNLHFHLLLPHNL